MHPRAALLGLLVLVGCEPAVSVQVPGETVGTGSVTSAVPELPICINEFVADNATTWQDDTGAFPDWIELHNSSAEAVALSSWYFTNDPEDPFKYPIDPTLSIEPGGYLVFSADDQLAPGATHLPFLLANEGEVLGLFRHDATGEVLTYGPVQEDFSWARQPDCCAELSDCLTQVWHGSPGASN